MLVDTFCQENRLEKAYGPRYLMFVIVSQRIKPSPFTSLWSSSVSVDFIFQIMLGSKENIHHFLSSIESTRIPTFRIINQKSDRTTLHTPH